MATKYIPNNDGVQLGPRMVTSDVRIVIASMVEFQNDGVMEAVYHTLRESTNMLEGFQYQAVNQTMRAIEAAQEKANTIRMMLAESGVDG